MINTNLNSLASIFREIFENPDIQQHCDKKEIYYTYEGEKNIKGRIIKLKTEYSTSGLLSENITWSYYPKPEDKFIITQTTHINNISEKINDILENERFDESYLSSLTPMITEDVDMVVSYEKEPTDPVVDILKGFDVKDLIIKKETNSVLPDIYYLSENATLSIIELLNLEAKLAKIGITCVSLIEKQLMIVKSPQ